MDKLKNIGAVLWYNKERIILAVMVIIFGWRVYVVLNPEQSLAAGNYRLPKSAIDSDNPVQDAVPPPPAPRQPASLEAVYTPNPFWFQAGQGDVHATDVSPEDVNISLIRIQKGRGGRIRAQIQTAGSTQWFDEGASFESFQLLQINADEGTCQVRSERLGKNITLRIQGN